MRLGRPALPHLPHILGPRLAAELEAMLAAIGREIARLHDGGLVHGDLTTSNMIVREADKQVVRAGGGMKGAVPGWWGGGG